MIKIVGTLLIVASTTTLGIMYSPAIKKRIDILETIYRFFGEVAEEIRHSRDTTYVILSRLIKSERYKELSFLKEGLTNRRGYIEELIRIVNKQNNLLAEIDKKILTDFFLKLGKTDVEGQMVHSLSCQQRIMQVLKTDKENTMKKAKMMNSLGVLSGIFISIFMI